jgi:micrococcal nuclease
MTTSTSATPTEAFVYRLKELVKVIDGDTVDLDLDLGFSLTLHQRERLYGVDAPGLRSKDPVEKGKSMESQVFVVAWFQREGLVLVRTTKEEKYGRMLADCYREGAPSFCTELLDRGLARPHNP